MGVALKPYYARLWVPTLTVKFKLRGYGYLEDQGAVEKEGGRKLGVSFIPKGM